MFNSAAEYKTWRAENPDTEHRVEEDIDLQPPEMCFAVCKNIINGISEKLGVANVQTFLSGPNNFRKEIDPSYKANRKPEDKPIHYNAIRDYMEEAWSALSVDRHEADDLLGIYQCRDLENSVIVTIDKDLDMIPGWHYNFIEDRLYEIGKTEGIKSFYKQLLRGDVTDNIPGLPPYYDVGNRRINESWVNHNRNIDSYTTERDCWNYCYCLYSTRVASECLGASSPNGTAVSICGDREQLINKARLLWILREYNQLWVPSDEREPYF